MCHTGSWHGIAILFTLSQVEFTTTQTLISNFYQLFVLFKIDHFVILMETHDHVSIYTCICTKPLEM
jgi:hypothetical protein